MTSKHIINKDDGLNSFSRLAKHYGISLNDIYELNKDHINFVTRVREDPYWGYLDFGEAVNVPSAPTVQPKSEPEPEISCKKPDSPPSNKEEDPNIKSGVAGEVCADCPDREKYELYWVPHCEDEEIGDDAFVLVEKKEADNLKKEEGFWADLSEEFEKAKDTLQEKAITKAKEKMAKALEPYTKNKPVTLVEIKRVAGTKLSYVRSDKLVKAKKSKVNLSPEEKKTLGATKNKKVKAKQIDKQKAKETFEGVTTKLQKDVEKEYNLAKLFTPKWEAHIDTLNKHLNWTMINGVIVKDDIVLEDKDIYYDGSSEAQLMRFYSGAAGKFSTDPETGKIGIQAEAEAKVALFEGKLELGGYFPNKAGHPFTIKQVSKSGKKIEVPFGNIRGKVTITVDAFAGASIQGSVSISIDTKGAVKGVTKEIAKRDSEEKTKVAVRKVINKALTDQAPSAAAEMFAGAKGSGSLVGTIDWQNPYSEEAKKDKKDEDGNIIPKEIIKVIGSIAPITCEPVIKEVEVNDVEWKQLLTIECGIEGSAGLGAEFGFKLGLNDLGQIIFHAQASVTFGLGAGGKVSGVVNKTTIWELVQFIYNSLEKTEFSYQQFIKENLFEYLVQLTVWALIEARPIEAALEAGREFILIWWNERQAQIQTAEQLAKSIISSTENLRFATPEAKGAVAYLLSEDFSMNRESLQEDALWILIKTIKSKRELSKICERVTINGKSDISQSNGLYRMRNFLTARDRFRFDIFRNRLN